MLICIADGGETFEESSDLSLRVTHLEGKTFKPPPEEELSELSDGDGYLYPEEDDSKIKINSIRFSKTRLPSVKKLYHTDKVFGSTKFNMNNTLAVVLLLQPKLCWSPFPLPFPAVSTKLQHILLPYCSPY